MELVHRKARQGKFPPPKEAQWESKQASTELAAELTTELAPELELARSGVVRVLESVPDLGRVPALELGLLLALG